MLLYTCNCTNCQNASGSSFALNMPVFRKDFRILQGEPKGWHSKSPMGTAVTSWFCETCGGRLYGERTGREAIVNIRAGTLDDTKWLVPAAHMYLKSAQPWVSFAPGPECYDVGPDDFTSLSQKWRAAWSDFFPPEQSD